jgi:glycosyltransferase involved in cell wall biosynthesis|tara:strand:- start:9553 stop:10287 length:735 start_codon:yes stop_codon:yes gene_type:complete
MKISIICPTRKRKKDMARLLKSIVDTADTLDNVEIIFVIDDDDLESIAFVDQISAKLSFDAKRVVVERNKYIFSDLANQALSSCSGELYLAIGDDGVFRTTGWDTEIIEEFTKVDDKILLLHFNDLSRHCMRLAGHLVVHQNWIDTVGYFSPPWFDGDWGDWWMTHLADGVSRRKYRGDIIIEHLNIQFGKAEPDETFYEHKERRQAFASPDKNPDHPFNTKVETKKENISNLLSFIDKHKSIH